MKTNIIKGYSLVEMLIVIFIFTILAVIITQSLAVSLKGSKKSDNISTVKSELDRAIAVMERHLRYGKLVCTGNLLDDVITYQDQFGNTVNFTCNDNDPADTFIASNSARLTSPNLVILNSNCQIFSCGYASGSTPAYVDINITARDKNNLGAEGSIVTLKTRILTRDY